MSGALAERIAREHAAVSGGLPVAVVSAERRRGAIEAIATAGLPTSRDENWKYANLRPVDKTAFRSVAGVVREKVTAADLPPALANYSRFVFVDGVFSAVLSARSSPTGVGVRSAASSATLAVDAAVQPNRSPNGSDGVKSASPGASSQFSDERGRLPAAHRQPLDEHGRLSDERFALLNDAFATDGAVLHASRDADCTACVEILFVATTPAQEAASYPRLELDVEANARVGLIERHISAHSDSSFVNGAVRVSVGPGAQVDHYRLQQAGARATWIDTLTATVAKDGRYAMHLVGLGALSARSTLRVQLGGERAEAAIHVVSLGDGQQVQDGFALIEHIAPNTKSDQSVRAIAAGRSRVAFNSKVVVREHAKGTDSQQSLRGLLAGAQAEIDVRPQLEIYTDDVRCNHGATAGKLDDNMLFYMLSRGIERDIAQQLLKWAFLEDVVSRIAVPELRKYIELNLAGQMKETAALKELL